MRSLVLLRGVNVGGKHKLAMKDLAAWLELKGFVHVRTYIQSGNVVLDHDDDRDVAGEVHDVLAERTGWDVPVIVRRAREMHAVRDANPYPDAEPRQLHVAFFTTAPDVGAHEDAERWRPEGYRVAAREVYLFVPEGLGRSVMAPRLTFLRPATLRNWNTVVALTNLLDD